MVLCFLVEASNAIGGIGLEKQLDVILDIDDVHIVGNLVGWVQLSSLNPLTSVGGSFHFSFDGCNIVNGTNFNTSMCRKSSKRASHTSIIKFVPSFLLQFYCWT